MVTIMAFTSAIADNPTLRVMVQPSAENGLRAVSLAMIDHIQSVREQHIGAVVGQLADTDLSAITQAVAVYLGMADPRHAGRRRSRPTP